MAKTRKATRATTTTLASLDLQKSRYDDGGKLQVEGATIEKLASEYRDAQEELDLLMEAQKERKQKLIEAIAKKRLAAEKKGAFYKTAAVMTDDESTYLNVIWGDRYSAVDMSHEPLLKKAFGAHYDDLFAPSVDVKAKDGATLDAIRELLGPTRFESLARFLKMTPKIKLQKGFMEQRADLRKAFPEEINEAVDVVIGKVQAAPSVKIVAKE